MSAAIDLYEQISNMHFTLNPVKIVKGSFELSYGVVRFSAELASSMIPVNLRSTEAITKSVNRSCKKYGIPTSTSEAVSDASLLFHTGVTLTKEIGGLAFKNVFKRNKKDLTGELAMIIAPNRPIGRQLALKLAENKAKVICVGQMDPEKEIISKTINDAGGHAHYYKCDVTNAEEVERLFINISKEIGDVTMYFNCSNFPAKDKSYDSTKSEDLINGMIKSNFLLLQYLVPIMKGNGKGRIVFMKPIDAMLRTNTQRMESIVSHYAIDGLYESLYDKLTLLRADDIIKLSIVRIYPSIEAVDDKLNKDKSYKGLFGDIDAGLVADIIIDGVKKGKTQICAPYTAAIFELFTGLLPTNIKSNIRKGLYKCKIENK